MNGPPGSPIRTTVSDRLWDPIRFLRLSVIFRQLFPKRSKSRCLQKEGRLPDAVIACVGGGSNAIGSFYHFIEDKNVRLIGCEAAGRGIDTDETAATIATGRLGIFHGMKSYFCQDEYGQIAPVYSISAGLDYPGVGPEHAYLHDMGRAEYVPVTDDEAVDAFEYLCKDRRDHSGDRIGACSCSCNESCAVNEIRIKIIVDYDFRQRR